MTNQALMDAVDHLLRVIRETQPSQKATETSRPGPKPVSERKPSL